MWVAGVELMEQLKSIAWDVFGIILKIFTIRLGLSFWFVGITNISGLKEGLLTEQLYNGDKFRDVMLSKKVLHVYDC